MKLQRLGPNNPLSGGAPPRDQRRYMMRALDCVHPAHEDMHATAENDEQLIEQVRQHIAQAHPDMSPDEATEIVRESAYDE